MMDYVACAWLHIRYESMTTHKLTVGVMNSVLE